MTLALLTMSRQELERAQWMLQLRQRRTTQIQAAEHLGLSVRQVERLYRAYKTGGTAALVSKKRGRPSARKLPHTTRTEVLRIVRERYADFGPTLAHEKLIESHGVKLSIETLRQWMMAEGIWLPRAERAPRVHQPRRRRACLGELVQIDGCDHEWFETRAPRCVLLVYVDDATSRLMHLRFVASESTFDYFESTRQYLREHGKPVAFYSDKASIFRVNAKQPRGGDGFTQFARAMGELNIDILCANTPQAKGRVERAHLTLQDRLVKELRLRDMTTIEAANRFVPRFIADYNRRFAREPASQHNAHRPVATYEDLNVIFRWKEKRKLTHSLTLHYKRSFYLVDPSPEALALRGTLVEVHEMEDGTVHVRHGDVDLPAATFYKDGNVRQQDVADNKHLAAILEQIRKAQIERDEQRPAVKRTLREKRLLKASLEGQRA
jgi:transposase